MALSFRRNGDGSFGVTLPLHDRSLLELLIPQMREMITTHDPATGRLFPNPYPDHDKAADDYSSLIGDDLQNRHLEALNVVEQTLDAKRLDEDQFVSWMRAVNQLRLFIGTQLNVDEDSILEDFASVEAQTLFQMYSYLGHVLELMVRAIAGEDYDDRGVDDDDHDETGSSTGER